MRNIAPITEAGTYNNVPVAYVADESHIDATQEERDPVNYMYSLMVAVWAYDVSNVKAVAAALKNYYVVIKAKAAFYAKNAAEDGSWRITDRVSGGEKIEGVPLNAKLAKADEQAWVDLTSLFVVGSLHFYRDRPTFQPASGEGVIAVIRESQSMKEGTARFRLARIEPMPAKNLKFQDAEQLGALSAEDLAKLSDFVTEDSE